MQNQPRRHHYVPIFYLGGFTKSGSKDGLLYVLDKQLRKTWGPVTPNSIAFELDYYKIDTHPESDPMVIEKTIGDIESICSKVIYKFIEERMLPIGTDYDILLNFVALMATRVPAIRNTISTNTDRLMKRILRTMLKSNAGWQHFVKTCEASGQQVTETQQETKAIADSEDYNVNMDQSWHVGMMLELGSKLVPELSKRNWSLWLAEEDAPDLICSDSPVCLSWHISPHPPLPPGFAMPGTFLIMPINRRIAIAGTYEELPPISYLDKHSVATVNRSTLEYAIQIYSCEADFMWATTEEHIAGAKELLNLLGQPMSQNR